MVSRFFFSLVKFVGNDIVSTILFVMRRGRNGILTASFFLMRRRGGWNIIPEVFPRNTDMPVKSALFYMRLFLKSDERASEKLLLPVQNQQIHQHFRLPGNKKD